MTRVSVSNLESMGISLKKTVDTPPRCEAEGDNTESE